jgi:hypothetical protein
MSEPFQDDGIGMYSGAAAESSFDLAVGAICDLVEGDGAPSAPLIAPVKEGRYSPAPLNAAAAAASTQAVSANISKKPDEGEVYINKDGKKVRRVKRSEKRMKQMQQDATDSVPPPIDPGQISNQEARSEAQAQRAAAAAASAALLGAGAPAAPTSVSSDSRASLDGTNDVNWTAPSLPFKQDAQNDGDYSENNEDEADGDRDLDYKTGLAKQHEDAERQMLEGEEGRRGFESTDDEDDKDDEGEEVGTRAEGYINGPATISTVDGASLGDSVSEGAALSTGSTSAPMKAGPSIPTMPIETRNVFYDEQVAVSNYNPTTNLPLDPIEDPSSMKNSPGGSGMITNAAAAEDVILDPGDIRAALSSASGGHDITESDLNRFDPLHVAMPGTVSSSQSRHLSSGLSVASSSYPDRQPFEETTTSPGPLWNQAGIVATAAESQHQYHQWGNGKMTQRGAIGQTIRDECWSRAAVDAGEVAPDMLFRARSGEPTSSSQSETERVATKRVNVVQLLINGLIGLVGGLLGSIYVQTGCHFVTVDVGLPLHFGMWQYSPMDSAFQGFTYCYPYDENHTQDSPTFARIAGLIALAAGTFSLSVLWVYLLLGRTTSGLWKWAVRFLALAACLQTLTFSFFGTDVCRRNSCSFGPGSIVSLISALSWGLAAYEMKDNSPIGTALIPDPYRESGDMMNQQQQQQQQQQGGMELTGYRAPVSLGVNA